MRDVVSGQQKSIETLGKMRYSDRTSQVGVVCECFKINQLCIQFQVTVFNIGYVIMIAMFTFITFFTLVWRPMDWISPILSDNHHTKCRLR